MTEQNPNDTDDSQSLADDEIEEVEPRPKSNAGEILIAVGAVATLFSLQGIVRKLQTVGLNLTADEVGGQVGLMGISLLILGIGFAIYRKQPK